MVEEHDWIENDPNDIVGWKEVYAILKHLSHF